jgi:hypothetical protein
LAVLGALAAAGLAPAQEPSQDLEGLPIVRIVFERFNIFDTSQPDMDKWFYRVANSLHIVSKESYLRSRILFEEGDPFSQALADESARILRSLDNINPVEITAAPVDGGVEVTVETHDQWTLEVGATFGLFGNQQRWGLHFQETNFLGRGKKIDLEYNSDPERSSVEAGYFDPNVFGSRWRTQIRYADLSDGFEERLWFDRPFYSLATERAWGAGWQRVELTEYLYSEADKVVGGERRTSEATGWYGMRFPGGRNTTHRLTFGFLHRHTEFGDWAWRETGDPYPMPEDRLIDGPTVRYERVASDFTVVRGFRAWSIQEDVGLGPNLSVGLVVSNPAFGGDIPRLLFDASFDVTRRHGNWLVLGRTWIEGRIDDGDARNWVFGINAAAAQLGRRGFQFRVFAETSHELDLERQLTLGAEIGLRGWNPFYFDGTGRALANAQWRTLVIPNLFKLVDIGVVVFTDAGITWDPRVGRDTDGVRADAGFGLILDVPKFGLANLARIEIGFPDDGGEPTVIITTQALF